MPISKPAVFSVVTVCLNTVTTIDETVASVLAQTYPHLEYIVVDGGSTDGTVEQLKNYGTAITRLISERDTGIYNAMNKALGLAAGDVVVFLNAGDRLADPLVLETVAANFAAHPDISLIYGDHIAWFSPSHVLRMHQPKALTRWELWLKPVCHQTIFARCELFAQIGGFDERLRICADWDWTIRAVLVNGHKAVHLAEPVCYFRMGGVSANRIGLQQEGNLLHRRYYTRSERFVLPIRAFFYKIVVRVRSRDFGLPWVLRQRLAKKAGKPSVIRKSAP